VASGAANLELEKIGARLIPWNLYTGWTGTTTSASVTFYGHWNECAATEQKTTLKRIGVLAR